ncbi:hypothetical protein Psi01_43630 [Planobispora siamensis]|uniref:Uncharacterized protein n=1 Tax=Planobispora siamensis TaxID=936338 RepID=A0A8J3SQA2_9ACTN|nr:hypothetical protein Psi01_43630 [Planobispora siamensis]
MRPRMAGPARTGRTRHPPFRALSVPHGTDPPSVVPDPVGRAVRKEDSRSLERLAVPLADAAPAVREGVP